MNLTPFLIMLFILNFVVLFILMYLFMKIKSISRKMMDVSYDDVKLITETLKDLVVESEKVSEKLENSIKEKEGILEDLVSLIDSKLKRLESADFVQQRELGVQEVEDIVDIRGRQSISEISLNGMSLREKVIFLSRNGMNVTDIAKKLGISVTEVNLVIKHGR